MNRNPQVSDYIAQATPEQIEILEALRDLVHDSINGVSEEFKWSRPVFALRKHFAYLQASKKHVTLGFYNPENIEDPNQLLEGSGKMLRHIKIKTKADIDRPLLKRWLQQSVTP